MRETSPGSAEDHEVFIPERHALFYRDVHICKILLRAEAADIRVIRTVAERVEISHYKIRLDASFFAQAITAVSGNDIISF